MFFIHIFYFYLLVSVLCFFVVWSFWIKRFKIMLITSFILLLIIVINTHFTPFKRFIKSLCFVWQMTNDLFRVNKNVWVKCFIQNQNQILVLPLIQCQIFTLLLNLALNLNLILISVYESRPLYFFHPIFTLFEINLWMVFFYQLS